MIPGRWHMSPESICDIMGSEPGRRIGFKEKPIMVSEDLEARARRLHHQAIVIDGHSDILIPVTEGKMQLGDRVSVPDPDTWEGPPGLEHSPLVRLGMKPHTVYFGPMGQYDLPRSLEGGLTAQVYAIYLDDDKLGWPLRRGLEMAWHLRNAVESHY